MAEVAEGGLSLRPTPTVVIPYAEFLVETTPDKPLRIRRDFRRLLAVIETVTFLYQAQRETDDRGRLVATVADYAMARPLLANLVKQAEAGLSRQDPDTGRNRRRASTTRS